MDDNDDDEDNLDDKNILPPILHCFFYLLFIPFSDNHLYANFIMDENNDEMVKILPQLLHCFYYCSTVVPTVTQGSKVSALP